MNWLLLINKDITMTFILVLTFSDFLQDPSSEVLSHCWDRTASASCFRFLFMFFYFVYISFNIHHEAKNCAGKERKCK